MATKHTTPTNTGHIHPPKNSMLSSYSTHISPQSYYNIVQVQHRILQSLQAGHHCCNIHAISYAHWLPHEETALCVALITPKNKILGWTLDPIWKCQNGPARNEITHLVTILASVELFVWVVLGSGRPLHNRHRPAERAQRLSLSRSTQTCRGWSARAYRHLQPASACFFVSTMPAHRRFRHCLYHGDGEGEWDS